MHGVFDVFFKSPHLQTIKHASQEDKAKEKQQGVRAAGAAGARPAVAVAGPGARAAGSRAAGPGVWTAGARARAAGAAGPGAARIRGESGMFLECTQPVSHTRVHGIKQTLCIHGIKQTLCIHGIKQTLCIHGIKQTLCIHGIKQTLCMHVTCHTPRQLLDSHAEV